MKDSDIFPRTRVKTYAGRFYELHRNTRPDHYDLAQFATLNVAALLERLNRYPELDDLYTVLSRWLDVPAANLLVTSGIDGGIKTILETHTRPGDRVMCIGPTYAMYQVYARIFGLDITFVQPDYRDGTFHLDTEALISRIDARARVVMLPNPNEPIETLLEREQLAAIAERCRTHGAMLLIDEAYHGYGAPTAIDMALQEENVIVARTFSKAFGLPAIRVGYLVGAAWEIARLTQNRFAYETNSVSAAIAMWALDNTQMFRRYIAEVVETRDWMKTLLTKNGIMAVGGYSNTLLLALGSRAEAVASSLKSDGYLVRTGFPSPYQEFVSVTIGKRAEMELFYEKLMQLLGASPNE